MFDDNWHLALASYNGGPARVQRAMTLSKKSDFWSLSASRRYLPDETREYVPMILASIIIARNPSLYGFTVDALTPLSYETVKVSDPIDLRRIAEWVGVPVDDIQALNPELRRWTTPIRTSDYDLKVPVGSSDALRVRLVETSADTLSSLQWHTVKRGETLLTIARQLNVKQTDLAEANFLSVRARVATGQQLIIPREPTTLLAARAESPAPEPQMAVASQVVPARASMATPAAARLEPQKLVYRVKRGDTLFSIARLYNTTVESLKGWNAAIIKGNRINVGDRLTIFAQRVSTN
jgi:membrane-bound lytic murein transglycosylase D